MNVNTWKVEFKIQPLQTSFTKWENLPVFLILDFDLTDSDKWQINPMDYCAANLSYAAQGLEVRWNFLGSLQGHYCKRGYGYEVSYSDPAKDPTLKGGEVTH